MLTITALGFGGTSLLANLKFALNIQNLISKRMRKLCAGPSRVFYSRNFFEASLKTAEGDSVGSTDLGEIIDISIRKLAHSKNDFRNGIF